MSFFFRTARAATRARAPAPLISRHSSCSLVPFPPPSDDTALRIRAIQVLDEARSYLISQAGGGGATSASAAARAAALEAAEAARLAGRGVAGAASGAYSSAAHAVKDAFHIGGAGGMAMPSAGEVAMAAGRAAGVVGQPTEPSAWKKAAAALHLPTGAAPSPQPSALSSAARQAAAGLASMGGGGGDQGAGGGGGLLASMTGHGRGGNGGGLTGLMMGVGRRTQAPPGGPTLYERVTGTGGAGAPAPPSVLDKVKDALHMGGKAVSEAAGAAGAATAGAAGAAGGAAGSVVDTLTHSLASYASDAAAAASDAASSVSDVSADTAAATARKLIAARDALDKQWGEMVAAYEKTSGASRAALAKSWADARRAREAAAAKLDEVAHHLMVAAKKAGWEAPKVAVAEL